MSTMTEPGPRAPLAPSGYGVKYPVRPAAAAYRIRRGRHAANSIYSGTLTGVHGWDIHAVSQAG
jgi:hypothetical protein